MKSKGAALLALTGDLEFNKHLRMRAHDHGCHLNEFGLWRWQGVKGEDSAEDPERGYWEMVKAETEEEILDVLGMEWVEPERRNFKFVVKREGLKGRENGKEKRKG
jgi:DNA polymerase beta